MSRGILILVATAISFSCYAAPEVWTCRVNELPEGQTVRVSLARPHFDYYLRLVTDRGEVIDRHESLISDHFVTSYQIHHSGCRETITRSPDELRYEFVFQCGSVMGALRFDRESRSGSYFQDLAPYHKRRDIPFSECQLLP